jgi:hypothetical protein
MQRISICLVTAIAIALEGCVPKIPPEALQPTTSTVQDRQRQSRRFDTKDEKKILVASAQVLQDLGFNIDESSNELGVIVCSKDRDATETGQVVGAIAMAVLFGANAAQYDTKQKIRASLVTKPNDNGQVVVRITFQRLVWNNKNQISKIESIDDTKIYQEFFDKLSQSVFLTAQEI